MSKYRKAISQEEFERIERFLLGNMDAAEQADFEHLLQTDQTLRNEVALQRQLMSAVEIGSFKAKVSTRQSGQATPTMRKLVFYWRYVAAAVLVIGIGMAGWWLYNQQTVSKADLYATYFRPDTGLPVVMHHDSTRYFFNEGMVSYKEGNYEDALGIWEQLVKEKKVTDTLHYYMGMAHLNMENDVEASDYLIPLSENEHSVFREKAIWYLALLHVKDKDYAHAKRLLMQLPEKEEALELLDRMAD